MHLTVSSDNFFKNYFGHVIRKITHFIEFFGCSLFVWIGLRFQIFTKYIFDQISGLCDSNISELDRWKPDNFVTLVEAGTVST